MHRTRHGKGRPAGILLAGLWFALPLQAQNVSAAIDEIFAWASAETPGCAVAVGKGRRVVVDRAYGSAHLERGIALTTTTALDAGSLAKQVVAAAVLLLVEEGRIALDDDVRRFIPELPAYGERVTIDHLLTHTSGVRDWVALRQLSSGGDDALALVMRQSSLDFPPGKEWSYSNGGYVLLKEVVNRVADMPFPEFARDRLFEPMGMGATEYVMDVGEALGGTVLAYRRDGDGWRADVLTGNDRGGGALFSTASDLVRWNHGLAEGRLGPFVTQKLHERARLANGRELDYARGLFVDEDAAGPVFWHTGSSGGFKSFLTRHPEQDLSIALLCNAGDAADRAEYADRISDLFIEPASEARPEGRERDRHPPRSDGDLDQKAGLFVSDQRREPLRLVVTPAGLRIPGGPPLVREGPNRFRNPRGALTFMSQDEFEIRFVSTDGFDLVSMEGDTTRYHRAEAWAPDSSALHELAGRYENDELPAVFRVERDERGLNVRFNGSPPFGFTSATRDVFQRGPMTLRFLRDEGGRVVGLSYSNPAVRSIELGRVSGGEEGPEGVPPADFEPNRAEDAAARTLHARSRSSRGARGPFLPKSSSDGPARPRCRRRSEGGWP